MIRVPIWLSFLNFPSKNLSSLMIYCQLTIKVNLFLLEVKSKFSFGLQFYRKLMQNYMEATIELLKEKVIKCYQILLVDFLGK